MTHSTVEIDNISAEGLFSFEYGGAIDFKVGTVSISNSTFSSNSA